MCPLASASMVQTEASKSSPPGGFCSLLFGLIMLENEEFEDFNFKKTSILCLL